MKPTLTRIFPRHGSVRGSYRYLFALAVSFLALPCLLSAQTLQHRYSFVSNANDSVGTANGTIVAPSGGNPAIINNGLILAGGGGGGYSGYVTLPSGILGTTSDLTIECWLTQNMANTWATPWDFANNNNQNFGLITDPGNNNGLMETAFTPHGNEQDLQSSVLFPSGSRQYVTVTYSNATMVANLYLNGVQVGTTTFPDSTYAPGGIGGGSGPTVNALGNDIYGDSQFQGTIYEFRIWNGVVSPLYLAVSAAAGPSVLITDTTVQSVSAAAGSVAVGGNEQATATANFTQVSGVPITAFVTNWVSSNPGVLTVSSSGVITGVAVGTATVSATVNGVTGSSANIAVTAAPVLDSSVTLANRWSFNEIGGSTNAYDSINSSNIMLEGGTYLGGGVLTLPGGGGNVAQLPNGIVSTYNSITIETWLTDEGGQTWSRAWSIGGGTTGPNNNFIQANYIDLIPKSGPGQFWTEFNQGGTTVDAESGAQLPTGNEQYTVVSYDAPSQTIRLYRDGVQVAIATGVTITPASLGFTYNNYLGLDQWNDAIFKGTFDEMRIWNAAVSPLYQAASAAAGPSVVITNSTVQSVSVTVGSGELLTGNTEQALANGGFKQVSGVPVTTLVTNWVSSNPGVLTVNSSGLMTGVAPGTATVSATVGGVTGTSAIVTVGALGASPVLVHRYSFVSDASDSVGTANGTIMGPNGGTPATINNGLQLPGSRGGFGVSGYVSLPNGIIAGTTNITVECWVTQNKGNGWAELWDFGNDGNDNFALIPYPVNNNNNIETVDHLAGNNPEIDTGTLFPNNSEQYVAVTYNNASQLDSIYLNAALIGTLSTPNIPGNIGGAGGTTQNYLGNDVYGDWQFNGTVYEFRIWNGAVSPVYLAVSAVAGPSVVVNNLNFTGLSLSLTTTSMIGSQTQQAELTANFPQASNVPLDTAATNWTSSNPSVLSVSSSGLITANSGGTATVSATVSGVTATSQSISVSDTAPIVLSRSTNETVVATESGGVLSVQALGGGLSYQWSFDSMPILGATNASYSLPSGLNFSQGGTYSVLISNNIGSTNVTVVVTVEQPVLLHRYSFVTDASDSVGTANGTPVAAGGGGSAVSFNHGLILSGGGGGDYSGYVSLPAGLLTNTTSLTIECWLTEANPQDWAEVWDFANNNNVNFGLIPNPDPGVENNGNMVVADNPNNDDIYTTTPVTFPVNSEQYVTYTFNQGTLTANIYTNGIVAGTQVFPNTSYIPGSIGGAGGTTVNALGNDIYGDDQFQGTIYEFRIWNGAVSPLYTAISAVAGSGVVVTNLTPTLVSVSVAPSMIQGQTQQASVTGNFADASGVPVTAGVTNWTSSNPTALPVDTNGVITALANGSATIRATVNGVTGSSTTITVQNNAPVITQEPVASLSLLVGTTLNASVGAVGTPPFTYFWYTNSGLTPISISSSPTLTIPDLTTNDTGSYVCVVSNTYGVSLPSSALSLTVNPPSTYEQAILSLNPLGFWPLNELSGTTAYDVVGGNNGTYTTTSVNGSSYAFGQPGPANAFFGGSTAVQFSSAYVDIPEGPFNITGPITVVAWVQLLIAPGFDGIVGHGDPSWRMSVNPSSQPGANDGVGVNDATSPTSILDDNWHMVAYTYTGHTNQANNGALYVDGALVASNTVPTTPTGDNLDVWIGGSPDYGTARLLAAGNIADVAIFSQAFTAAQIQGLTNGVAIAGPQTIAITRSGPDVVLNWQIGTLLQSTNVLGPWTTNSSAVAPYSVPATNRSQFFKLLVSP